MSEPLDVLSGKTFAKWVHLDHLGLYNIGQTVAHELTHARLWVEPGVAFRMSPFPSYWSDVNEHKVLRLEPTLDDYYDEDGSNQSYFYTFSGAVKLLNDKGPGAARRHASES
jgi:hypothetical protein